MEDSISRQAVLDALKAPVTISLKERIMNIPSAEPKWIPVTEMLPVSGDKVLVYFKERYIKIAQLGTHEVEDNNFRIIGRKNVWYTDMYYCDFDTVLAWIPLPEPYKGGAEWKGQG